MVVLELSQRKADKISYYLIPVDVSSSALKFTAGFKKHCSKISELPNCFGKSCSTSTFLWNYMFYKVCSQMVCRTIISLFLEEQIHCISCVQCYSGSL